MNTTVRVLVMLAVVLSTRIGCGQVHFSFNYLDQSQGFSDSTMGQARRNALEAAANNIEELFGAYTANIVMDVQGDLTDDDVLASATSHFHSAYPGKGFVDYGDIGLKIRFGDQNDPAPNLSDGVVSFNFDDHEWELANDFQFGEYDLISTAMHELLHAVGFLTSIEQDGSDLWGGPLGQPGTWSAFDEYVGDESGVLIDESYSLNLVKWATSSNRGAGDAGLYFVGPNAMDANDGLPVQLYSPLRFDAGSSVSHLDDSVYRGTYLMESAAHTGPGPRIVSELERAILADIGYAAIIVPEPRGIAILSGLGFAFALWRRAIAGSATAPARVSTD